MEKGTLKVKVSGKVTLKIVGKPEAIPPKIFIFKGFEPKNYECDVELEKGEVVRIVVDGKDVPKNDQALLEKQARIEREEAKAKLDQERNKRIAYEQDSGDSFALTKACVPSDTRDLIFYDGDNFHLKLNRFARFDKEDAKFSFFRHDKKGVYSFQIQANNYGNTNFSEITTRAYRNAKTLLKTTNLINKTFTPNWRLIVGLGGESVYETSITLHHIYGFPYIPASSIKGVLRSFIIQNVFFSTLNEEEQSSDKAGEFAEGKAIADETFCEVFGCPAQLTVEGRTFHAPEKKARQGQVIFFDALPTASPKIKPDIMNPHYPNYYGDKKNQVAPTDTQSPVPVFFLTVENTPFQFLFGSKQLDITQPFWNKTLAEWLTDALTEHGIGAKTAAGYGYMKETI